MKIAMTGHTGGLGLELYTSLSSHHEIVGFALENGYDIAKSQDLDRIVLEAQNYDCFINNAYHEYGQTELLKRLYKVWYGQPRTIVNIGSAVVLESGSLLGIEYQLQKTQQLEFARSMRKFALPNLINIMPHWIDTKLSHDIKAAKMTTHSVAELIVDVLKYLDKGICIQELYFSHNATTQKVNK